MPVPKTFRVLRTWILRCLEPRTWKQGVAVLSLCWGGPGSCWHLLEVHSQCKAGERGGLQAGTARDIFTRCLCLWRRAVTWGFLVSWRKVNMCFWKCFWLISILGIKQESPLGPCQSALFSWMHLLIQQSLLLHDTSSLLHFCLSVLCFL